MKSNKKIFCFIHIPRTSGFSIKKNIDKSDGNIIYYNEKSKSTPILSSHITIFNLKEKLTDENKKNLNFFTVVRNPYDRIYSLWKYFKVDARKKMINDSNLPDSFEDFIINYYNGYYDGYYVFQSQEYFLKGEKIENIKILKYENRYEIKKFLLENNVLYDDFRINHSPLTQYGTYEEVYSDNMKEMVYDKLQNEFNLFSYKR